MKRSILAIAVLFFTNIVFGQTNFKTGQSLGTMAAPQIVASGDINNDGLDDVIAVTAFDFNTAYAFKIFVYLQDENGELPTTLMYSYPQVPNGIRSVVISDVNNDSLNDFIIGLGDSIAVFTFDNGPLIKQSSFYSGKGVFGLHTGDMNNDGLTDIVAAHWNESFIKVFYQNSTGFTNKTYSTSSGGFTEIVVADVTSDGLDDVVCMSNSGVGAITVFKQNSSGALNNYITYLAPGNGFNTLNGIAVGDLNNDGANDVAAARSGNQPDGKVIIWLQDTATGKLLTPIELNAYDIPSAIEVADLNCDGKPEIITTHGGWEALTIYHQDVNNKYSGYVKYKLPTVTHPLPKSLAHGDINNDGKTDLISVGEHNTVQLLYNISIPTVFSKIDTVITNDTVYSAQVFERSYYQILTYDTVATDVFIKTDSFMVIKGFAVDSAKLDTVLTRFGNICGNAYSDKVIKSLTSFHQELILHDTVFVSTTLDTVSLINIAEQNRALVNIKYYPNPTFGKLHVSIDDAIICGDQLNLVVYDQKGNLVHSELLSNNSGLNEIELGELSSGIYTVVISSQHCTTSKHIIKL